MPVAGSRQESSQAAAPTRRGVAVGILAALALVVTAPALAQSTPADAPTAPDVSAPAPAAPPGEGPLMLLGEMTYVSTTGDITDVIVDAENARVRPVEDKAHLQVVHARMGAAASGVKGGSGGSLDMTCDRGVFEFGSGDFEAEGNVSGITGDGRRFRTSELSYIAAEGLVTTNAPVVIRDSAGTFRGRGFRYWIKQNRFRLLGGASVVQN